MNNAWNDNQLQFSRLLSEIAMVGLTRLQLRGVKVSTKWTDDQINELFIRAVRYFQVVSGKGRRRI